MLIKDAEDARVARVRALLGRKERDKTGLFWTEGLRFVAQAVQGRVPLETVLWVPKMLTHPFGQKLMRQCRAAQVPCWEVTPEVFLRLSRAEEAQWIGAVGRQRWTNMVDAPPHAGLCWLALDTVQSPGNLGTILRTCEATGAAGVILIGPQADPYDPGDPGDDGRAVRAAVGAGDVGGIRGLEAAARLPTGGHIPIGCKGLQGDHLRAADDPVDGLGAAGAVAAAAGVVRRDGPHPNGRAERLAQPGGVNGGDAVRDL